MQMQKVNQVNFKETANQPVQPHEYMYLLQIESKKPMSQTFVSLSPITSSFLGGKKKEASHLSLVKHQTCQKSQVRHRRFELVV